MFLFAYKFLFFLIDLLKVQRDSFYHFLEKGLVEELNNQKPLFWTNNSLKIIIYGQYYQLLKLKETINTCLRKGKTYQTQLFIPVHIH